MRIETKTETVVKEINTYIVDDGKEFDTKEECEKHEQSIKTTEAERKLEELRIKELKRVSPLTDDNQEFYYESDFGWFLVNKKEDVEYIESLYEQNYDMAYYSGIPDDISYPTYYGIEEECGGCIYGPYTLEQIQQRTVKFFKKFGVEVEFKKGE